MASDDIKRVLASLGLSDKEISLYLTMLSTGAAPASALGKRLGMVRSTAQYLCQQLMEKGLARLTEKEDAHLFSPEPPDKVMLLLELQQKELERKRKRLQHIIPEMKSLMPAAALLPRVRYYHSGRGILSAWREILNSIDEGAEMLSILHPMSDIPDELESILNEENIRRRVEKKIFNRVISTDHPASHKRKKTDKENLRETRIMKKCEADIAPSEIFVLRDWICLVTGETGASFAVIIENQSLASLLRETFDSHWRALG